MELKDKIAGALYGMALGDAMGMPAELWGRERARKFFGGKITGFIDGPKENDVAFNYNKAQFTDDRYSCVTNRAIHFHTIDLYFFRPSPRQCIADRYIF